MVPLPWQLRAAFVLTALVAVARPAAAEPVFGPSTYERTTGEPDVYTETFAAATAGGYALWIQNGEAGEAQVESATVNLNGTDVVTPSDFAGDKPLFAKRVNLLAGDNNMTITIAGEPGTFMTLLILPPGVAPSLTVGRLLLTYASAQGLVLDLKNGSHRGSRGYRVVFYDADGQCVASSNRLLLPRRGSVSQPVSSFIVNGGWTEGSIEIFYAGHGLGRMFGQASEADPISGVAGIVPLEHAGSHVFAPADQVRDDEPEDRPRRRRKKGQD